MNITDIIQDGVIRGVMELYGAAIGAGDITMNATRKEFEGDYTVVVFPFSRIARKKPDQIGEELGAFLVDQVDEIASFNVIKGFLNLVVSNRYWHQFLDDIYDRPDYGQLPASAEKVMVEYSSPNTNKPLHLGHIRNILLGWSTSKIMEAAGHQVVKVQIVNDRGIAICKSMLAWQKFGEGATPASTGMKSDHFVGEYYVMFEKKFQEEYQAWQESEQGEKVYQERGSISPRDAFFKNFKQTYFNEFSLLGGEAKEMLLLWEAGDEATRALWEKMNGWVYEGFDVTYDKLGVSFDKLYYESETYLLGKDLIAKGLETGVFYRKDDGSVWADLSDANLDHKLVLRSDGTSVYITQDLGTARIRYDEFGTKRMIYVVADEQNYHFQVLFELLKRLEEPYADGLYHLAYGMVDLTTGRMKSREGTVVDADDLIAEVVEEARKNTIERGTIAELLPEEQEEIIWKIGMAALKFFIIKVHPRKRMTFDPEESVDLQGQTGPYVQNAYVRVKAVLRKSEGAPLEASGDYPEPAGMEKEILLQLHDFPEQVRMAAAEYDPSTIANYCYNLAKNFHRFYHDFPILRAESEAAKSFRLKLSTATAAVLEKGMGLLGIEMPERM